MKSLDVQPDQIDVEMGYHDIEMPLGVMKIPYPIRVSGLLRSPNNI